MGTPRWSQRSYECLFRYWRNGLIFMMDEGSLYSVVNHKDDWRVALMAKITEWMQENESTFIPIVAHWDVEEATLRVPSLAEILAINQADIPHLYLYHPYDNTVVAYPDKLDDSSKYSPELIMAWAEMTVLQWILDDMESQLEHKYFNEETQQEEFAIPEDQRETYRHHIKDEEFRMDLKKKEY